jgi:hypothetical protein
MNWQAVPNINRAWNKAAFGFFMLVYSLFPDATIILEPCIVQGAGVAGELSFKVSWFSFLLDLEKQEDSVIGHKLTHTHPATIRK